MSTNKIEHLSLRLGNLVTYIGSLNDYYNSTGEIISIDPMNGEYTYLLRVKNWKKDAKEIRAYKSEIMPITLEKEHLEKIGFEKDEKINIFRKGEVTLIRPMVIGNNKWDDKGFVVVTKDIPLPLKEEDIEGATVPVTSFHSLQNYFSDYLDKKIDTSPFL